jgi:hypothetical protein
LGDFGVGLFWSTGAGSCFRQSGTNLRVISAVAISSIVIVTAPALHGRVANRANTISDFRNAVMISGDAVMIKPPWA